MEKDKYKGVSDEELLIEQKKLQKLNTVYGVIMIILFFASVYLGITKQNYTMVFICLGLFSIFFVNINSLKDFKKEIKKRNLRS